MIDYHVHTALCRHAAGTPAEYLAQAKRRGLAEIGFSDHFPLGLLGFTPQSEVTMRPGELPRYIEEIKALAADSPAVTVKLGVEVDFIPGKTRETAALLAGHPFDYVIGSIHFMDGWDFTHPACAGEYRTRDLRRAWRRYFELVWEACRSGLFDIIGHIDVIKKFGYRPPEDPEPFWRKTAEILKKTNTCVELNTAGRDAPVGEFYPPRRFLELCRAAGVPATLGSDAHAPEQVGRYFEEGAAILRAAGYSELAVFTGRRRSAVPLGEGQ